MPRYLLLCPKKSGQFIVNGPDHVDGYYDGKGTVTIKSYGSLATKSNPRKTVKPGMKPGEVYVFFNGCDEWGIRDIQLPLDKRQLVMWLGSYERQNRAETRDEYEQILAKQRSVYSCLGKIQERTVEGEGYAFTVFDLGVSSFLLAAAYVDSEARVTKSLVFRLLKELNGGIVCPMECAHKILMDKFDFSQKDIRALWDWEMEHIRTKVNEGEDPWFMFWGQSEVYWKDDEDLEF